tara:strand:+ start:286 stop:504 length:219 start_codon:yes stop_codon:yes gene_type:complete
MRGKSNQAQVEQEQEQYRFSEYVGEVLPKKRLDLNDLLRRAKDEKRSDKKLNLLIFSGSVFVISLFVIVLSF